MTHLKTMGIIILPLLLLTVTIPAQKTPLHFNPTDITIEDIAFNNTNTIAAQWWYFDAIFSNNYSLVVGIFHLGYNDKIGFFFIRINMYKDGAFIGRNYQFIPMKHISHTTNPPKLSYKNNPFYQAEYDSQNLLSVNLSFSLPNYKVNLTYKEVVKGWKGYTGKGWWSCPLPSANVSGTLIIDNETYTVEGKGYHEHAWRVQSMHRSWKWGKFSTPSMNIIFSKNMKNQKNEDIFITVVNIGSKEYVSIARENIEYTHTNQIYSHGKIIPITSNFVVQQDNLSINVTIEVQTIHFTSLILLKYWRSHVKITGEIIFNGNMEIVEDKQLMEYLYLL